MIIFRLVKPDGGMVVIHHTGQVEGLPEGWGIINDFIVAEHSGAVVLTGAAPTHVHPSVMKRALDNALYNMDRTFASAFGAPAQETISSEIGRHENNPLDKVAAEILDAIQPEHCENAVKHADALEKVDDGFIG